MKGICIIVLHTVYKNNILTLVWFRGVAEFPTWPTTGAAMAAIAISIKRIISLLVSFYWLYKRHKT